MNKFPFYFLNFCILLLYILPNKKLLFYLVHDLLAGVEYPPETPQAV